MNSGRVYLTQFTRRRRRSRFPVPCNDPIKIRPERLLCKIHCEAYCADKIMSLLNNAACVSKSKLINMLAACSCIHYYTKPAAYCIKKIMHKHIVCV